LQGDPAPAGSARTRCETQALAGPDPAFRNGSGTVRRPKAGIGPLVSKAACAWASPIARV